ncbi:MAG TPA: DUF3343 domain-containing protein [Candidatus Lachnoclostridium stercoravium]|uniref:DUF3343 domain-containing protein n=1 Tax=Candidatus Lachnoclostridium stercoravium TaxID=2838633 RepID=A0A9D2HKN4_9FIRM|nr:DUF3343 domain-containing protein [Candidatus Lachnoclostridium stercoravium]
MRRKENRMVIAFSATAEAAAMDEACRKDNMPGRLIPLPTVISAGCGFAWSAPADRGEELLQYMEEKGLSYEKAGIYFI